MCVIKAGYHVAEKCFVPIPLLPPKEDSTSKFVVDTLCSIRACLYRSSSSRRPGHETMVQSLAQCTLSCGNPSCFYQSCHVVLVLDPPAELYRVVLDVYKG
jgi:hypothetical protein